MYCRYCGHKVPDGSKYCENCGRQLRETQAQDKPKKANQKYASVKRKRRRIKIASAVFLFVALLVAVIGIKLLLNEGKQNAPIVYITDNRELKYLKNKASEAVQISSQSHDLEYVMYSDDKQTLYYCDSSMLSSDSSTWPLYCVDIDSLDTGKPIPKIIDENVTDNLENSYAMEPLSNGRLIYIAWDYAKDCSVLKYFDGNLSSVLVEGEEIYVTLNSDKTLANICVRHDEDSGNNWSWYRMTIEGYPSMEYVCDGTLYLLDSTANEQDFQKMVENDVIICTSQIESGYTIDLYVHGKWKEKLVEFCSNFSAGPFGIEIGEDISFYMISSSNLEEREYYPNEWTFYRYKNRELKEVNKDLRFPETLPSSIKIIYYMNGCVYFRWDIGLDNLSGWIFINEEGEIREINDNLTILTGVQYVEDEVGTSALIYSGRDLDGNDFLYACSEGTVKKLLDGLYSCGLYSKDGEERLVGCKYGRGSTAFSLNLSNINIDTIEKDISFIEMPDTVFMEDAMPYSDSDMLYIGDDNLYCWNEGKPILICDNVDWMWSDWSLVIPNSPRIY